MKNKIPNVAEFKRNLIKKTIDAWELQAQSLENQFKEDAKETRGLQVIDPDLVAQQARVSISRIRTPLNELKLSPELRACSTDDLSKPFALFDVTTAIEGKQKTICYFSLPIENLENATTHINVDGVAVQLLPTNHRWQNSQLNKRKTLKGGLEIWEEPHMGQLVKTGSFTKESAEWVSYIYL